MVISGRGGALLCQELDSWILNAEVKIVSVDAEQIEIARDGWRQYGKGRHKAGLNFGDCFSYALSKVSGEPLLFVGNDFALTDVEVA
jgi:ribonuclease VapC